MDSGLWRVDRSIFIQIIHNYNTENVINEWEATKLEVKELAASMI